MAKLVLGFLLTLAITTPSIGKAAPTPAQLCESAVELASAKYAQCRLTAESKHSKTGDAGTRTAALSKCSQKLSGAFSKAMLRYGAHNCTGSASTAYDAYLSQCSDEVAAAAVAGGTLPSCGNGSIDMVGEQCDGLDLGGDTCASLGFPGGGALGCTPGCAFDTSACHPSLCGNGTVDGIEKCDGTDLDGATCASLGFTNGGALACDAGCAFDTSGCTGITACGSGSTFNASTGECEVLCGNGGFDPGETCEVDWSSGVVDLDGRSCVSEGFQFGDLKCSPGCVLDTSGCRNQACGDGIADAPEACDGADLEGQTCATQGFDAGTLGCTAGCALDTSGCVACGAALTNGSFECGPNPPSPGYQTLGVGSTEVCGWLVTDADVDIVTSWWVASNGTKSIDLNGSQPGAIAQTFSTTPGALYNVSFDMAGNTLELRNSIAMMEVRAAGQSATFTVAVGNYSGPPFTQMDWTPKTWSFTAVASSTTIEFRSLNLNSGAGGPALDNVRVSACP